MYNQITTTTTKYLLPNGKEWKGAIHQMPNGDWMTGAQHNRASVVLIEVPQILDFPEDGFVAKQDIFLKIFNNAAFTSRKLEGDYAQLDQQLIVLEKTILDNKEKINSSIGRLDSYIASRTTQSESQGTGSLVDSNIGLTLPPSAHTIHTSNISSISFVPSSTAPHFVYFGNAETGLNYEDKWLRSKTSKTFIEIVSRLNPEGYLPTLNEGYEELDLSKILQISTDHQVGFSGKITIQFSSQVLITSIYIPLNSTATASNLKVGESYLYNEGILDNGTIQVDIEPTRSNFISFDIEYTEPVPFSSQIHVPLVDDVEGNPVPDLASAEDFVGNPQAPGPEFIELSEDRRVYQKTRLEFGKVTISSKTYKNTKTFTNGPYYCKSGTLRSLFMEASEVLNSTESHDSFFTYTLLINGKEFPIGPSNRESNSPRFYYINSKLSRETQTKIEQETGSKFVTFDEDVVEWNIRTTLTKAGLESHISPKVNGLKFMYTTSMDGGINV